MSSNNSAPAPRLCAVIRESARFLALALPLLWVGGLLAALMSPAWLIVTVPNANLSAPPSPMTIILAFAAILPVILLASWGLMHLRHLFTRYSRGEVFTTACANHIRQIGMAALLLVPVSIVARTAGVSALSLNNGAGERIISVGFSSNHIGLLLAAGFLFVLGQVMHDAARLADENAGFV